MTRPIKFRVWQKPNGPMMFDSYRFPGHRRFWLTFDGHVIEDDHEDADDVTDSFAVMQWTGWLDENGQEVYKGDIVENATGRQCEVYWFQSPAHIGFDLKARNNDGVPSSQSRPWIGWAVVGNIYEGIINGRDGFRILVAGIDN